MRFVREDQKIIEAVSEKRLRQQLGFKTGGDTRFAILEDDLGNFIQMVGGGVACCLEWKDTESGRHCRAFVDPPRVPWKAPGRLGPMMLDPNEFLDIELVTEAFCAFLNKQPFPDEICWRDVSQEINPDR